MHLFCVDINVDAEAATSVVDSTVGAVDAAPGDGVCANAGDQCTLRAAIQESNAFAGVDTTNLPTGTYSLTIAGTGENVAAQGDRDITDNLTGDGAGAVSTIVNGNGQEWTRALELKPEFPEAHESLDVVQNRMKQP